MPTSDYAPSVSVDSAGVKSLQLGVGRSMIVDLPEDASEIFVGEPKVANAIVRSPRRIYISTLAAGQTTIFALSPTGRKIAVLEITVGRDVGELAKLFDAAIPGNDIHVSTVGGSIILTGSVASAGEAQKALDIAEGFLYNNEGGADRPRGCRRGGLRRPGRRSDGRRQGRQFADDPRPRSGQPARHRLGNPPRHHQTARRQLQFRRRCRTA